jgi:hypothetical protein
MRAGGVCCGDWFVIGLRLSGGVVAAEAQPRLDADAAQAISMRSHSGRTRRVLGGSSWDNGLRTGMYVGWAQQRLM